MQINLTPVLDNPGARLAFSHELDFSDFEFGAQKPVTEPVRAAGEVINKAGVIFLLAEVSTLMHCICDRCATPFEREEKRSIEVVLSEHPDEDETEAYTIVDSCIDIDEVITSAFVLAMDSRFLCRPDCKGICDQCGADLNDGLCDCAEQTDPRWAPLKDLL